MSPHNYEMKFNGSRKHIVEEQYEYYDRFTISNMRKGLSSIPRFFGKVRAKFNRINKHYEGAQKTPEHPINPEEFWRDLGRP